MPKLIKKRVTEEVYEVDEEHDEAENEDEEEVDEDDDDEGAVVEARSTAKVTKRGR